MPLFYVLIAKILQLSGLIDFSAAAGRLRWVRGILRPARKETLEALTGKYFSRSVQFSAINYLKTHEL